ncbi:hypothetical protein [Schleiferilactobacillus shenzhenensis]|uniref:Uncharacterized protein n=1 Tax=Schleiferilactobacillus shenzhenensis LY-73 TaxID=1231336 RepID=U4TWX7_9LACO|nr:hypothetical protein [Schleiferilactobacillus shenzhenensis]ERL65847.1 hypothetical protein L248_1923 [Schleiferilactobacillus shenzhenensis LY-73]
MTSFLLTAVLVIVFYAVLCLVLALVVTTWHWLRKKTADADHTFWAIFWDHFLNILNPLEWIDFFL